MGRVDIEKTVTVKIPTGKEVAEAIITIGGGLIERSIWKNGLTGLKFKDNMDLLKNLFVGQ